jgi:hypothetical protein
VPVHTAAGFHPLVASPTLIGCRRREDDDVVEKGEAVAVGTERQSVSPRSERNCQMLWIGRVS